MTESAADTSAEILAAIHALQAHDLPTRGGRTLAYVYDSAVPGLDDLAATAYASAMHANALDPTAFPSLPAMEGDLVATAAALTGGGPRTVGTVTSGGTESCLLAVAAARDARPHVGAPRMVLAASAHAAFHKAAHYFRIAVDTVDVDPATGRADSTAMAAAITDDTVLVVASAPSYGHGVVDPIAEIAESAAARGVRCHVDACIGGWILGSWRRYGIRVGGRQISPFGLDVPGVTSLSVDLHKYAYAPKGASVLLHADAELRAAQYFVHTDWPGYAMLNTTLQSTRSGGPIAAAWAVVKRLGDSGYRDIAERTARAVTAIREGIARIPGIELLTEPDATLLAVTAADGGPNVFTIADEMAGRGFYVQPQFSFRAAPASVHLTVTAANAGHEDELLSALADSVAGAATQPDPGFPPKVVDAVLSADLGTPNGLAAAVGVLGLVGAGGEITLPRRMASINALLDALPSAVRDTVLRGVLSMLTNPGANLLEA